MFNVLGSYTYTNTTDPTLGGGLGTLEFLVNSTVVSSGGGGGGGGVTHNRLLFNDGNRLSPLEAAVRLFPVN